MYIILYIYDSSHIFKKLTLNLFSIFFRQEDPQQHSTSCACVCVVYLFNVQCVCFGKSQQDQFYMTL